MQATRPRVSYSDLERMPDDGRRYELYGGEVFVIPAPFARHQRVVARLFKVLDTYATVHSGEALISPLDIVFSEFDVVQPDVVFFQASRRHLIPIDAATRKAPDLAVEVISSGTSANDRGRKMHMYARYGVNEYWVVDPHGKTIEIFALSNTGYLLAQAVLSDAVVQSPTLPDLSFPARQIFGDE